MERIKIFRMFVKGTERLAPRSTWYYSREITKDTEACLDLLYNRTTEDALLKAAGGNKWIVRRAIALYNRGLDTRPMVSYEVDLSNVQATTYSIK